MRGGDTDDTRSHRPPGTTYLGMVESELVGPPGKTSTRESTRRLRFDVNAAGRLHSMVLSVRFCCCCR